MAKKVLIPLDGSEIGEAALHYVEEMISNFGLGGRTSVILIHVVPPAIKRLGPWGVSYPTDITITEEDMELVKQEALTYLEKSAENLTSRGVEVKLRLVIGSFGKSSAEDIIKAEEDLDVDLVAMSTHGRRGIGRWTFGSVTEKVLRGGNVPVLVVRAKK